MAPVGPRAHRVVERADPELRRGLEPGPEHVLGVAVLAIAGEHRPPVAARRRREHGRLVALVRVDAAEARVDRR